MMSAGFLFWLVATHAAGVGPSGWEVLYELPAGDAVLTSVWLDGEQSWHAGGTNLIVHSDHGRIATEAVPGHDVYAFTRDPGGVVVAAGSDQAIWEERGGRFELIHLKNGPPLKGRAARGDALTGFGYLDPERPQRLVAYGFDALVAKDGPNGPWQPLHDGGLLKRATLGPPLAPPSGCHLAEWIWLKQDQALFDCHDGTAYLYTPRALVPLGRLPKHCGPALTAASLDGDQLAIACPEPSQLWTRTVPQGPWTRVASPQDIQAIAAHSGCIVLATRRQVLRRCSRGEPHDR